MQKNIDVTMKPTKNQIKMLKKAAEIELPADSEYPEFTVEELMQFKRISNEPVLSRILETALENPEIIKQ